MALGPKQMGEAIIRNLKDKTGKTLEEWLEILNQTTLKDKKGIIEFLKKEKGLGHFQAQKIFEHHTGKDAYEDPSKFAEKLFDTKKTKALYDFVNTKIIEMESDIRVEPCQTYIPFYRKHKFAILTKSKEEAITLGLNLPEDFDHSRFSSTSNHNDRINFHTELTSTSDFDDEISEAIMLAYKNN